MIVHSFCFCLSWSLRFIILYYNTPVPVPSTLYLSTEPIYSIYLLQQTLYPTLLIACIDRRFILCSLYRFDSIFDSHGQIGILPHLFC